MPQTTSAQNALDCVVKLDDSGGTLRDISGSGSSIAPTFAHTLGVFTTFDSRWPGRLDGRKDASFVLACVYSQGAEEGLAILRDWFFAEPPGARSIEIYVPDETAGGDLYYGEVRMEGPSFAMDSSDPNAIMVSVTLQTDGKFHHTTTT